MKESERSGQPKAQISIVSARREPATISALGDTSPAHRGASVSSGTASPGDTAVGGVMYAQPISVLAGWSIRLPIHVTASSVPAVRRLLGVSHG